MKSAKIAALIGFFFFVTLNGKSYPYLIGDTVSVSRQIPSTNFIFGPDTFTVQAGPADTIALSTGNNSYLNVEDTSLQLTFGPSHGSGGPYTPAQHFILFQDLTPTSPDIVGLTFETDLVGFNASYLSFTAHTVTIDEGGLNCALRRRRVDRDDLASKTG